MSELIAALLAVAVVFLCRKLWVVQRGHKDLARSIEQLQPFLLEGGPAETHTAWEALRSSANRLIAESIRLQAQRTGQLAQLEATLGSLQEAVLILDANNYVLLANAAMQAIFPRAQNVLHQRVELVLHSTAFHTYVQAVRRRQAEPRQEIEFVGTHQSTWVQVTGTLIPALGQPGEFWSLFVLQDVTRQRQLENLRRDFVANVSHELRTPLSVIKGFVETLVDGHHDMPTADRERFLRTIQRHTERLNSLVEDLLTLSRLESPNPALRLARTPLAPLIEAILEDYRSRPQAAEHRIVCALDPAAPEAFIDASRVQQVFENLLDNALKYTPKRSCIRLSTQRNGASIEVCVRDDGQGIPAADLPHVFERFYRVDKGRSREKGGHGLGLSIVKHIVQLHGGRVWAESEPGKGTAIFFTLPAETREAAVGA